MHSKVVYAYSVYYVPTGKINLYLFLKGNNSIPIPDIDSEYTDFARGGYDPCATRGGTAKKGLVMITVH